MLYIAIKEITQRRIYIQWVCFLPTSNWKTGRKKESHFNSLDKVPMGSAIIAKHSTWKTPFSKPTMTFQHLPIFFAPLHTECCCKDQFFNLLREFVNISYLLHTLTCFHLTNFLEKKNSAGCFFKNKVAEFFFSKKFRQMKSGQNNNMILQRPEVLCRFDQDL